MYCDQMQDDYELLELMVKDSVSAEGIYNPGPYWNSKSQRALRQIKRVGISDFRGRSNSIGVSFTDCEPLDATLGRGAMKHRIASWVFSLPGLAGMQKAQVALARSLSDEKMMWKRVQLADSARVGDLLAKYLLEDTTRAGCFDTVEVDGQTISIWYLSLLDTHDHLAEHIDYTQVRSMLEIGGGFGAYTHLLISNYPNMKKFLYLDIAPNLYIGTQYLRSHFPGAVRDYRDLRKQDSIRFREDNSLEILCITPFQLQEFVGSFDLIHNSRSFVEMPPEVVANYADISLRSLANGGAITLVSYDGFDKSTIPPQDLPTFFSVEFERSTMQTLRPGRMDYHFVHKLLT